MKHVARNVELMTLYIGAKSNVERFEYLLARFGVGQSRSPYLIVRDGNTFNFEYRDGKEQKLAVFITEREDFDFENVNLRPTRGYRLPAVSSFRSCPEWRPLVEMVAKLANAAHLVTAVIYPERDHTVKQLLDVETHQMHFVVDQLVMTVGCKRVPAYEIPSSCLFDYLDKNYPRPISDHDVVRVFTQQARVVINVNDDCINTNLRPKQFLGQTGM